MPFWPPKWSPGGAAELGKSAGGRSKTVLGSSWFGPFFVLSFGIAFLVVLGSILGPSWGHVGVMLVPFSSQVGPGIVFESSYHRKSDF